MAFLTKNLHRIVWCSCNALEFYIQSKGAWLLSRPRHRLFFLLPIVVFLSPPKCRPWRNLENVTTSAFQIHSNIFFNIYPNSKAVNSVAGNRIKWRTKILKHRVFFHSVYLGLTVNSISYLNSIMLLICSVRM
jgi:hypothetical protein